MPILPEDAYKIHVPRMIKVQQIFPDEKINNISMVVRQEINRDEICAKIMPGAKIALLVGSRGIANLSHVMKAIVENIKRLGGDPFIIPAMGSHGGGIAKEQESILSEYGITETLVGAPILTSMETVMIAMTNEGIPIYIDKIASQADIIIPIARIKTHTDFDAPIESGLCKMLAIGLGKHTGCSRLHQEGFDRFPILIPEVAKCIIEKVNIGFGIALIENAHDNLHTIKALTGDKFLTEEPKLLALSKSLMPRLNFEDIDVLILEQIGKDISGAGVDPNIIGKMSKGRTQGFIGPNIKRIVVLGLSEGTHGNATGIGVADFITRNAFNKIDSISTFSNCIAAGSPEDGKIPIVLETEEEAILAAIQTCTRIDVNAARVVRIKDSLHLVDIEVSETLVDYCRKNKNIKII